MNEQALPSNAPLGAFRNSFLPRKDPGKAMLLAAVASLLACAFAAYNAVERSLRPAMEGLFGERMRRDAILVNAILSIVLLLIALLLLGLRYAHSKARVDLYENGIVVSDWKKQTMVLWEEVWNVSKEAHYGKSTRIINWTYTITCVNGQKVRFRGLEGRSRSMRREACARGADAAGNQERQSPMQAAVSFMSLETLPGSNKSLLIGELPVPSLRRQDAIWLSHFL